MMIFQAALTAAGGWILFGLTAIALLTVATLLVRTRSQREAAYVALEHLPQSSVVLFDRDLRLEMISGPAVDASGLEPGAAVGKKLEQVVGPEQAERLSDHFEAALAGQPKSVEYSSPADGHQYWLKVVPIYNAGQIAGGMALTQDITERRESEQARIAAEGNRRLIFESMKDAYLVFDPARRVADWNPSAEQMFGLTREEAVGRGVGELLAPEGRRREFDRVIDAMIATSGSPGSADRVEVTLRRVGGEEFPAEVAGVPVEIGDDLSVHLFVQDISRRRNAQRRAAQHTRDLESLGEAVGALARATQAEDVRRAICTAAARIASADAALLYEPDPSGTGLRAVAAEGLASPGELLPFVGPTSGATTAFTSGEPLFVADVAGRELMPGWVRGGEVASALWVPVLRDQTVLGVISVAWEDPVRELDERQSRLVKLIAAEAAVTIERAQLLTRLERIARTDQLTGLLNRRAWDEEIHREVARAQRTGLPLSVAMLDLDHFKRFNDENGHQAGDRLLKECAGAWRAQLRETDLLARYGGEEFVIALPDCDIRSAGRMIGRVREATPGSETCSAGIAQWEEGEEPDALVGRADAALYAAKAAGRDQVAMA